MEKTYFHKKKLVVNTIQLKKIELVDDKVVSDKQFFLQIVILQQISCFH